MHNRGLFRILFLILFIAAIGGFGWYYLNYQQLKGEVDLLSDPTAQEEAYTKEVEDLVSQVGKHIILPEGEMPELATIQDADALAAEQAFFQGAVDGDKLLIYSQKALLYSPSRDILVNVGPVYVSGLEELDIDIRNGSDTGNTASELSGLLAEKFGYNIVNVGDAGNFDYEETILVNLGEVDASVLENELGITAITELPEGESDSEADVVIIIGSNAS